MIGYTSTKFIITYTMFPVTTQLVAPNRTSTGNKHGISVTIADPQRSVRAIVLGTMLYVQKKTYTR